ncbi:prepilin-type N-terminal cleavage/methylation domain-containing protein [bacterium]|nr:prepilin-type N-terminal cleavage/methylation domain-containing protein [bacterium]
MVRNTSKQAGFTLIELLVVVVIIGILASVAIPNFMGAQDKAKNSGVQANAANIQSALEQYSVDFAGQYPPTLTDNTFMGAGTGYITAFPRTPWNTLQAANIAGGAGNVAGAGSNPDVALGAGNNPTLYNAAGNNLVPTTNQQFGALMYNRSGQAQDNYSVQGAGKRGAASICVINKRNF